MRRGGLPSINCLSDTRPVPYWSGGPASGFIASLAILSVADKPANPAERRYLRAMAELGEGPLADPLTR